MSRSLNARRLFLILSFSIASAFAFGAIASADDPQASEETREARVQKPAEEGPAPGHEGRAQEGPVGEDVRNRLRAFVDRAKGLRQEGAFEDAEDVEASLRDLLRVYGLDPRFARAADLRKRALEARFDGAHEDAAMYDREADRVLADATARVDVPGRLSAAEKLAADEEAVLRSEIEALRGELASLKALVEELRAGESTVTTDAK